MFRYNSIISVMLSQAAWLVLLPHEHLLYEWIDEFDPQITRQNFPTFPSRKNMQDRSEE